MAIVKVKCPYCGSEEVVLYGKSSTGKQRYLCQNKECKHKTFQLEYKNNASRPGMEDYLAKVKAEKPIDVDIHQTLSTEMDEMWSFYHDKSHQIWLWRAIDESV